MRIVELAVPCPLYSVFDYALPPALSTAAVEPGMRARVTFGRSSVIAIVIREKSSTEVPAGKLKPVSALLDSHNLLGKPVFELLAWAARYYNHPPGEVYNTALTARMRNHDDARPEPILSWQLSQSCRDRFAGQQTDSACLPELKRAARQQQLVRLLHQHDTGTGLSSEQLNALTDNWRAPMQALVAKQLVEQVNRPAILTGTAEKDRGYSLNVAQQAVFDAISTDINKPGARVHLVDGITGSGKTEIYLALCEQQLARNRQVLVMVPEIGLTPQISRRFCQRLNTGIAVIHSGMNDTQRHAAWCAAANGEARILIGTRSSVFTPLPELGLIIIDEEHDASFKQQDGFRYNARDLAVVRASQADISVVLGSATPSLETLNNVAQQRYRAHHLKQRANNRPLPRLQLLNLCSQKLHEGIADGMVSEIRRHLDADGQVLLFINRRGFAPLLMCHDCGWTTRCQRCDANMTYHRQHNQLHCHHCGAQQRAVDQCGDCGSSNVIAIGAGTERIEQYLSSCFADTEIIRIDRDSTRRKGSLEEQLQRARQTPRSILVGTQMLAKGHDFPNITLVGILDTDQSLFSADYRATENLSQLIIQVAGRAGRAERHGEVLIQTHHPEHPLLQQLLQHGYDAFARAALQERAQAGLPPAQPMALLRCESVEASAAISFLNQCRALSETEAVQAVCEQLSIYGPLTAPMEKRAGRYRYQLMLHSQQRKPLQQFLSWWVPQLGKLKDARKVRWSIDVDPYDTY